MSPAQLGFKVFNSEGQNAAGDLMVSSDAIEGATAYSAIIQYP